jgi:copper chaperone
VSVTDIDLAAAGAAVHRGETAMSNTTASYTVVGMTCNSCVNKVTDAVTSVEGVDDVDDDVADGSLEVTGDVDDATIRQVIADAGYQVA